MDSRERTFLSLEHGEPDRVPRDCWVSRATRAKIEETLDYQAFLDENDVDLRYIDGPDYIGPTLRGPSDADDVDIWSVPRRRVDVPVHDGSSGYQESYMEVLRSPLANCRAAEEVLDYPHWPSPDWFDYRPVRSQCERIRDSGRVVVFMGDRLNRLAQLKPAMYLRGTERIFLDLVEAPEIALAIFERVRSFYMEYGARIMESARGGIDILCTGDDFGGQMGLLISPQMWDGFLSEGFRGYVRLGKEAGARVMHHTCGAVFALLPRLADCGLDILQSLQPEAAGMDPTRIKAGIGDRMCFQGGISIQRVLPAGDPARIRSHVREVFAALAPGGGYIAGTSHNIQADVPMSAIRALFAAYRELGGYR